MDRFNSREDVEFDQNSYDEGGRARRDGKAINQFPPWLTLGWHKESFIAGWCDADMEMMRDE